MHNASRLENKPGVKDRIAYLSRQEEELIVAKRRRIEEQLWAVLEGNIQDYFEPHEVIERDHTGQPITELKRNEITGEIETALSAETRMRPKLLKDLSPEAAKLIEDVQVDNRGRLIPRLYSKERANKELRNMLNLSAKEAPRDVTQLSDAELLSTLAAQAKELGISIDLNYRFAQQPPATVTDGQDSQVIDQVIDIESSPPSAAGRRVASAAKLKA